MATTDPDAIAAAAVAILKPGGVPVGGIGAVVNRTPDAAYTGSLPIVMVKPSQDIDTGAITAGARFNYGFLDVIYRDSPPSQQTGKTLEQIETAMWAARKAIVTALRARPATLGGVVANAGLTIEGQYNPEGPFDLWQGAEFVGFILRVSYKSGAEII